jgi:hypothetical protein
MKLRLLGTQAECAKLTFLLRYGPPDLELRFPEGLPPAHRTCYSLTTSDGRPLLVEAWGREVRP